MKNTDRESEERYLRETLRVIQRNVQNYEREVSRMQEEIDEMLEHYHDNDVELWSALNNTITLNEHMKRALERNRRAQTKPYFGRIIFHDETLDKTESLYIGKGGISSDRTSQIVTDWRAPVANAYYENGLGKSSYTAPDGRELPIDLKLKRTFEIENGRLSDYYDTDVVSNDELLMKALSQNKEAVLGEIVATIQKEQNEIIRKSPYHNVIVQGVAGSGKTTVAMHRISYILYNYKERFRPEDFYIVGSNHILLNYITGVLPDLDVYGVRQMTMEQLFIRLLYEEWDEKSCHVREVNNGEAFKGTEQWYRDLVAFIRKYEWDTIPRTDVSLEPEQFVEGLQDGKAGVYDRRGETESCRRKVELMSREAAERYIRQNPSVSVQSKINMLNERLLAKLRNEFLDEYAHYTEEERKAIRKAYRGWYGGRQQTRCIYDLYRDFLVGQREKGYDATLPEDGYDVYDLAALALLYKLVKETEVVSEAHHIVIDEAQDFGMMAYSVLAACIKDCTYTVMGDVSQNIHFGYGLEDWEALRALMLPDAEDSFGILKKSYRNTVEISDFATGILRHGKFAVYPAEPVIRHGNPVKVERIEKIGADWEDYALRGAEICRQWREKGYGAVGVVCRDTDSARRYAESLARHINIMESDPEKASFGDGILVLPVAYTKGLEFDAVLIMNPTGEDYPVDDGHAKLLYVAATRALHELCILHGENLTGLIADPMPDREEATGLDARDVKDAGPKRDMTSQQNMASQREKVSEQKKASGQKISSEPETARRDATTGPAREGEVRPRRAKAVAAAPKAMSVRTAERETPDHVRPATNYGASPLPAKPHQSDKRIPVFGDMPSPELLCPQGHGKIGLNVRWVSREHDGLRLTSPYGILRISPVGSAILRITFAKGSQMQDDVHPLIGVNRVETNWKYRDNGKTIELSMEEIGVQVDKADGVVRFIDGTGRPLLAQRRQDGRLFEQGGNRWYLDFGKEPFYGIGEEGREPLALQGSAQILSRGDGRLPFLISERGYGILPAVSGLCFCCDASSYGSYLYMEGELADCYVIAAKRRENLLGAYAYLSGIL